MDWAEDCLYLRDLMVQVSAESEKASLREQATRYLCQTAYRHVSYLPSRSARWRTYLRVYKMFEYACVPPIFLPKVWLESIGRRCRKVLGR
jgi:hypothetical protein